MEFLHDDGHDWIDSGSWIPQKNASDCGCACSGGGCGCGGACGSKSNDDDFYGLNGRDQESMWDGASMRASSFGQSHPSKTNVPANFDDQFAGTFVEMTGTASPHPSTQFSGDILGLSRPDADSSIWDGTSSRIAGFMPGHRPAGNAQSVRQQTGGISSLGHDLVGGEEPIFDRVSHFAAEAHRLQVELPELNGFGLPFGTFGGFGAGRLYDGGSFAGFGQSWGFGGVLAGGSEIVVPPIIPPPTGVGYCDAYWDCKADEEKMKGTSAGRHILSECLRLLKHARDHGFDCPRMKGPVKGSCEAWHQETKGHFTAKFCETQGQCWPAKITVTEGGREVEYTCGCATKWRAMSGGQFKSETGYDSGCGDDCRALPSRQEGCKCCCWKEGAVDLSGNRRPIWIKFQPDPSGDRMREKLGVWEGGVESKTGCVPCDVFGQTSRSSWDSPLCVSPRDLVRGQQASSPVIPDWRDALRHWKAKVGEDQ